MPRLQGLAALAAGHCFERSWVDGVDGMYCFLHQAGVDCHPDSSIERVIDALMVVRLRYLMVQTIANMRQNKKKA